MFKLNQQISAQLKSNTVAIISLITALTGVFYDTWRDHRNEMNENTRNAAFEVLKNLSELQTVVNYAHYQGQHELGNPIEGWKYVVLIEDLSHLLPASNMQQSNTLLKTWTQNWESIQNNVDSEQRISLSIANTRAGVLHTIENLE